MHINDILTNLHQVTISKLELTYIIYNIIIIKHEMFKQNKNEFCMWTEILLNYFILEFFMLIILSLKKKFKLIKNN